MKKMLLAAVAAAALATATGAQAGTFINGGFEDGNSNGWTIGGGYRYGQLNNALTTAEFLPGGALYNASVASGHSSIISQGYVDHNVGAALGSTIAAGAHSWRVEDTTYGGYASVISQTVAAYTDPSISFAWKAVLEGAHAATMLITLTDNTTNTVVVQRQYNAASTGSGVDARFSSLNRYFYTPQWQVEQLDIAALGLVGDTFTLSVLASDCEPTGHAGYVYLDGFGSVIPPTDIPEPASLALLGAGLLGMGVIRRRRS